MKGPRWEDREGVEERSMKPLSGGWSEMGRSTAYASCPFCKSEVLVYLWSFYGCGKRCSCGALLGRLVGLHWQNRKERG
jgi:hypothetical protein